MLIATSQVGVIRMLWKLYNKVSFQSLDLSWICFLVTFVNLLTLFLKEYTIPRAMEKKILEKTRCLYYYFSSLNRLPTKDLCKF